MRLSHWLAQALQELHNGVESTPESQAQLANLLARTVALTSLIQVRAGRGREESTIVRASGLPS